MNDLRVYIRNNKFKDSDEEIDFFKHIKPNIYADFIFYNSLLKYHVNKPNTTNSISKNYFKNELKKSESKKRKKLIIVFDAICLVLMKLKSKRSNKTYYLNLTIRSIIRFTLF